MSSAGMLENKSQTAEEGSGSTVHKPSRETEIRSALKIMIEAKTRWANSPENFFPQYLEDAISAGLNVCLNGDIPASCVKIHTHCVRLADAWARIIDGADGVDSKTGIPVASFWQLFEAVETALKSADSHSQVRRLRPVKDLLEEYKSDGGRKWTYIARDYGWLDKSGEEHIWRGPFFNSSGTIDQFKIEQEAANPGSVVPAGYHPANQQDELRQQVVSSSNSALASIRNHLKSTGKITGITEDPASIEELIRQGQFPHVIARVKNTTEEHVRQVASKIGITLHSREDLFAKAQLEGQNGDDHVYRESMIGADEQDDGGELLGGMREMIPNETETENPLPSSAVKVEDSQATEPAPPASEDFDGSFDDSDSESSESSNEESVDSLLAKLYEVNPDIDTPRAMQALKSSGVNVTGQKVGRVLASLRNNKPAEHQN